MSELESELPMGMTSCKSCMGDIPHFRITKATYDKECKICGTLTVSYRWRPWRRDPKYIETVICHKCSNQQFVCQVCLADLDLGVVPGHLQELMLSYSRESTTQ